MIPEKKEVWSPQAPPPVASEIPILKPVQWRCLILWSTSSRLNATSMRTFSLAELKSSGKLWNSPRIQDHPSLRNHFWPSPTRVFGPPAAVKNSICSSLKPSASRNQAIRFSARPVHWGAPAVSSPMPSSSMNWQWQSNGHEVIRFMISWIHSIVMLRNASDLTSTSV